MIGESYVKGVVDLIIKTFNNLDLSTYYAEVELLAKIYVVFMNMI
ncbi:MAG: hypothetical protein E6356_00855 [Terrisporobacter othiniensis]|nr:hypothetical protein [Terrisporobacter petrolearius]MDU4860410.1 hypothetical protein [Terrisporobacter othiniensis]MDU6993361.1 hypothetical protein [Terrisporobacter othiniensis]